MLHYQISVLGMLRNGSILITLQSRQTHARGNIANLPITSCSMSRRSGKVGPCRPVNGHLSPTHSLDGSFRPVNEFHIGMRNGDLSGPTKILGTHCAGEIVSNN